MSRSPESLPPGFEPEWRTAIATADEGTITLRGHSLLEMIGKASFAEAFLLAATGKRPTKEQAAVLDAVMVAVIDHGIVPASVVTRYLAACGSPIQAAVAGGVMAFGDTYGGAVQQLAQMMTEETAADLGEAASAILARCKAQKVPVPGYGHPLHPHGDPRATALFAVAKEKGVAGRGCALALAIEEALHAAQGRVIKLNGDGAIAAIAVDLGLDWRLARALIFVPRAAGLAVHAVEEMVREPGWRHPRDADITYDGPRLDTVDTDAGSETEPEGER
jgi:citrate synthase